MFNNKTKMFLLLTLIFLTLMGVSAAAATDYDINATDEPLGVNDTITQVDASVNVQTTDVSNEDAQITKDSKNVEVDASETFTDSNLNIIVKQENIVETKEVGTKTPVLTIDPTPDVPYYTFANVTGTLIGDSPISGATVVVTINSKSYNVITDVNGAFLFNNFRNPAGQANVKKYDFTVKFNGNDEYAAVTKTSSLTVVAANQDITIESTEVPYNVPTMLTGKVVNANNTASSMVNSNLYVTMNGKETNIKTNDKGVWNFTVKLTEDTTLQFYRPSADVRYLACTVDYLITVIPEEITSTKITVDKTAMAGYYNDYITVKGNLVDANNNPISDATIKILVDGEESQATTDSNGAFNSRVLVKTVGKVNVTVTYAGNAKYGDSTDSRLVDIWKDYPFIIVDEIEDSVYGDDIEVYVSIEGTIYREPYADVIINLNGKEETITTGEDGFYLYTIHADTVGQNNITFKFEGNEHYDECDDYSLTFNVNKADASITVDSIEQKHLNEEVQITGKIIGTDPVDNEEVIITINGETFSTTTNSQGEFTYTTIANIVGTNNVTVTFDNKNYNKISHSTTFMVDSELIQKTQPKLIIDKIYEGPLGDSVDITGDLYDENNEPISGAEIIVIVNGVEFERVTTNNRGMWASYPESEVVGINNVTVKYLGNGSYYEVTAETTFKVLGYYTSMDIGAFDNEVFDYGQTRVISGTVDYTDMENYPLVGVPIVISVNDDENFTVYSDDRGYFEFNITSTKFGQNTYTAAFLGNDMYEPCYCTYNFIVSKAKTYLSLEELFDCNFNDKVEINGELFDSVNNIPNAPIIVTINGVNVTTIYTNESGIFYYEFTADTVGTNTVLLTYEGNESHNGSTDTYTFEVSKVEPQIFFDIINDVEYGQDIEVVGTLEDYAPIANAEVTIKIGDKEYKNTTNDEGVFSYTVVADTIGEINITATYETASDWTIIEVEKADPRLILDEMDEYEYGSEVTIAGDLTAHIPVSNVNVTLTLNGQTYTVTTDENGRFSQVVTANVMGDNRIDANFAGNDNYYYDNAYRNFEVIKADPVLTIDEIAQKVYGDEVTITGTVAATKAVNNSEVTVKVNDKEETVSTDENGVFTLTITADIVGTNNITVSFTGNDYYNAASNTTAFEVVKADVTITIDEISEKTFGDEVVISGKVTGVEAISEADLTLTLNGEDIAVSTDGDGVFTYTTTASVVGTNNVTVTFAGNDNYNEATATATFNVVKADATITIDEISEKTFGDEVVISGKVTGVEAIVDTEITLTLNGEDIAVSTDGEGVFTYTTTASVVGTNNVSVSFAGNDNYNEATETATFNVVKADVTIVIDEISEKTFGDKFDLTGKVTGVDVLADTEVTVTVNGVDATVTTDGEGVFTLPVDATVVGTNNVTVSFAGGDDYNEASATASFEVVKADANIVIDEISEKVFGDEVVISGKLTGIEALANVEVTVNVNGKEETTSTNDEGVFTLTTTASVVGTNNVSVSFAGDDNYNEATTTATFEVVKADAVVIIDEISDKTFGDEVVISGKVTGVGNIANEDVILTINGEDTTVTTDGDGVFTYTTTATVVGTNNITATFAGNDNYNEASATVTFDVVKADATITIDEIFEKTFGDEVVISGKLTGIEALGNTDVSVKVNGKEEIVSTDGEGVFTLTTTANVVGTNNVTVTFAGDDNYNEANADVTFEVVKADVTIVIDEITQKTFGDNFAITGTVNGVEALADTEITLTLNGEDVTVTTDSEGAFTYSVDATIVGTNNVSVSFAGDENYNAASQDATFEVVKADANIVIDEISQKTFGDEVVISGKLTGIEALGNTEVSVIVNGKEEIVSTDGEGVFTLTTTASVVGTNNVSVSFAGDDNYNEANADITFEVIPADVTIVIDEISEKTFGDEVVISGKVTGVEAIVDTELTLTLNGEETTVSTDSEGSFTYTTTASVVGTNNITVAFAGNENYNAASQDATFNVVKADATIIIDEISEKTFGDKFDLTGKVTGVDVLADTEVTVTVNGVDATVTTDGEGVFTLPVDATVVGTNNVTVSFAGDDDYNEASATASFEVVKADANIVIDEISEKVFGDEVVISGKLTGIEALGNTEVTVNVNGKEETTSTNDEGVFTYTTTASVVGTNNVSVSFAGDDNYNEASQTATFEVVKADANIVIDEISEKTFGDEVVISGKVTGVGNIANEDVILTINGEDTTVTTDGEGVFTYTTTATVVGTNNITATFAGNDNYNEASATVTFDVVKADATITIDEISEKTFGDEVVISGKLTGIDNIANEDITINLNGEDTTVATNDEGVFTYTTTAQVVGTNSITATFDGNDNYNEASATANFNVIKADATITIDEISEKTFGDNFAITGTVNGVEALADTELTITVNGVEETITTDSEGAFTYSVDATIVGTNNVTVAFAGNDNYNEANADTTFEVVKADANIVIDEISEKVFGDEVVISGTLTGVEVLTDAEITLNINGEDVTVTTDGEGVFMYTTAASIVGTNDITATFAGNDNYNEATTTATFEVVKADVTIIIDEISEKTFGDEVIISGTVTGVEAIADTELTITVNDEEITVTTDSEGAFTHTITAELVGTNDISVSFAGNDNYNEANATATFEVVKADANIVIDEISEKVFGDEVVISGTLTGVEVLTDAEITLNINGEDVTVTTDGEGVFTYTTAASIVGTNDITATFAGNDNYNEASATASFEVVKADTTITIDEIAEYKYRDALVITGKLVDNKDVGLANTEITLTLNGKEIIISTDDEGVFTYDGMATKLGKNTVVATYAGSENYNEATEDATFKVESQDLILTLDDIEDVTYRDNVTISGKLTNAVGEVIVNSKIRVTINDKYYYTTVNDEGIFTLETLASTMGENNVTVEYLGNNKYNAVSADATFNVGKKDVIITVEDIPDAIYTDNVTITGVFTDVNGVALRNSKIVITLNGEKYTTITDNDGVYTFITEANVLGENTVVVSYPGNSKYNGNTAETTFNVAKKGVTITVEPMDDVIYKDEITVTGKLTDADGLAIANADVVVKVNGGKKTVTTDENGEYVFTTTAKVVGDNTVTVIYNGEGQYDSSEASTTYNVAKKDTNIEIDDISYSNGKLTVSGRFMDCDGTALINSNVVLYLNGNHHTVKSDSEGVYTYTGAIDNGQVDLFVKYFGNEKYNTYATQPLSLTFK